MTRLEGRDVPVRSLDFCQVGLPPAAVSSTGRGMRLSREALEGGAPAPRGAQADVPGSAEGAALEPCNDTPRTLAVAPDAAAALPTPGVAAGEGVAAVGGDVDVVGGATGVVRRSDVRRAAPAGAL
jgi:hypothetical protein